MKISVQTTNIIANDLSNVDLALKLIRDSGFDGIDLAFPQYGIKEITAGERSPFFDQTVDELLQAYEPVKRLVSAYGIEVVQAHAPYPTLLYPDDKQMNDYLYAVTEKAIRIASFMGSKFIVVHPIFASRLTDKPDRETENALNLDYFTSLIPLLKECHMTVCLENMFNTHKNKRYAAACSDPYQAAYLIDRLNEAAREPLFGFCFDSGHALLCSQDPYDFLTVMGDRVKILHLHDNDGVDDQHLAPYMGIADWDRICKGLHDIGYRGSLNFETHKTLTRFPRALAGSVLHLISTAGRELVKKIR